MRILPNAEEKNYISNWIIMFSKQYLIHQRIENQRIGKDDKSRKVMNVTTISLLVFSAISGFTFYDTLHNDGLEDLNTLAKFMFCLTVLFEIMMKIGMAQPNCQSLVNYLLIPINKRRLFNTRTLLDCLQTYNFLSFSFFAAYFVRLGIEGDFNVAQSIICSLAVMSSSFLLTEIIKWTRTFKMRQTAFMLVSFGGLVSAVVYILCTNDVFATICKDCFTNVYICLAVVLSEMVVVFQIGYVQLSRQMNQSSNETPSLFSFDAFGVNNPYTKLLINLILRGKSLITTLLVWPLMGLGFIIVSKSGVLPEGLDLSVYGYAMGFLGVNFVLNPLLTKLSMYCDGIFLRDKNCIKPLINSYMVINLTFNTVLLILLLPIFRDIASIPAYMLNVSVMPFVYSLAITTKKCSRFDIFNPGSGMDNFSSIVMIVFILVVSVLGQIPARSPKVGFYMVVASIFISIVFLIIRNVWVKKATDCFVENRYEILDILRTDINEYKDEDDDYSKGEIIENELIINVKQ